MNFHLDTAEIFIPDNIVLPEALARTTHLCIAAHQDDIEIMAVQPILECFQRSDKWFTGVVLTDGSGSPRNGPYEHYSDEQMRLVRLKEQRKAAVVGEYAALIMLGYPSKAVKDVRDTSPAEDIGSIIQVAHPQVVFTHNLADKHDTHVAVALRVVAALRGIPRGNQPQKLVGCEVWRDLDWMVDSDKIALDLSQQENLQSALLGVYDSQIRGGKRYDLATLARRRANATYLDSHHVDESSALSFAMDMTPLLTDPHSSPANLVQEYIARFAQDVADRIKRNT